MTIKMPHDRADLLLSPVALAIIERLEDLGRLGARELSRRVSLETNMAPRTVAEAERAALAALTYLIDTHGWDVEWDTRGIRLTHREHEIVLGVPRNLVQYRASADNHRPADTVPAPAQAR